MKVLREEYQHFKESGGFEIDINMKMDAIDDPFTLIPPADKMIVFLRQHIGKEAKLIVKEGDSIEFGQKLTDYGTDNTMIVPVHSPVDGIVVEIKKLMHPVSWKEENAIILKTSGEGQKAPLEPINPDEESKEKLLRRVREAGIVGLGGAAFPTYSKLLQKNNISHLIINNKESDPNIACDYRLIIEKPKEIIKGIKVMAKILEVQNIIFATRTKEGKIPDFEALLKENDINLIHIKPKYSLGSERLLIKEVLNIELPSGKYPPDLGTVVHNVATAYAISRAIYKGEPLISRGLTLYSKKTGGKNLWVRMGTPVGHIFSHLGVSSKNFNRIVFGSIMMGKSIPNPNSPILKATSGITAFTKEESDPYANPFPCIRCGYCNTVCPVDIYPQLIMEAEKKRDIERLRKLHVEDCIECGLCSYVCPSRIRFTKFLTNGKNLVRNQ